MFASIVLRIIQFALTLLCLGLSAALPSQQASGGSPTRVNFAIFVSTFALLTLFYLLPTSSIPAVRKSIYHPGISLLLDLLNFIFFLSAAIALAAQLGVRSCSNQFFLRTNGITNGGGFHDPERRCREAQALTAFLWFGAVAWAVSVVVEAMTFKRAGEERGGARRNGGVTAHEQGQMSQV